MCGPSSLRGLKARHKNQDPCLGAVVRGVSPAGGGMVGVVGGGSPCGGGPASVAGGWGAVGLPLLLVSLGGGLHGPPDVAGGMRRSLFADYNSL